MQFRKKEYIMKTMDEKQYNRIVIKENFNISYYGEKDKAWKEIVMKEFKCTNYELVGSIDECIEKFKK